MSNDQAEMVSRLVTEQQELGARTDSEARATVHGLIQGYLGPDHTRSSTWVISIRR